MGDVRARERVRRWVALLLATFGVAGGLTTVAAPAVAGTVACTAWGTLPARVSIGRSDTPIPTYLMASAGCVPTGSEDSAAYLWNPTKAVDVSVWSAFGDRFVFDFVASSVTPGTYTLRDGIVLLTDPAGNWVDVAWRTTSTVVKYAGRFGSVTTSRVGTTTTIRATATSYRASLNAFRPLPNVTVYVDRATPNHSDWVTIGHRTSDAAGRIALAYRTDRHWVYRVRFLSQPTVWGATSGRYYR